MQLNCDNLKSRSTCAVSSALDVLGDKWTLVIIRDAMFLGATTFGQFRSSPEKIASNILTDRLEKLVNYGIMSKNQNPDNKLKFDYRLTETGQELRPILLALGKWGHKHIEGTSMDVYHQMKKQFAGK